MLQATRNSVPQTTTVRIVQDTKSKDGWIGRTRKGKICFIDNLDTKIGDIAAGQQWEVYISRHKPTFLGVELKKRIA